MESSQYAIRDDGDPVYDRAIKLSIPGERVWDGESAEGFGGRRVRGDFAEFALLQPGIAVSVVQDRSDTTGDSRG